MAKEPTRTMGQQSISKSFKGILRISHIMELIEGENDIFTSNLNSTYYGNPDDLLNISGSAYKSDTYCYQTAIKAFDGGINRYNSSNPNIGNDTLKLHRVPLTDSMGNYLNWNVGSDGVTIGSEEENNGDIKLHNSSNDEKIFPILKSKELIIGLENKLLPSDKKIVTKSLLSIESGKKPAQLIIRNKKDVSNKKNTLSLFTKNKNGSFSTTKIFNYENVQDKNLQTSYQVTKNTPENFDVVMYKQSNFSKNEDTITANVDIVNLKSYLRRIVNFYMKGNVVEVPSGTVIYQYCSLDKWRAYNDDPTGVDNDFKSGNAFPGHRPALQMRNNDGTSAFYNSTIQGACKKQSRLSKNENTLVKNSKEDESISLDGDIYLQEVIPLYKRDYVLCDGSVYRIPFTPILKNSKITKNKGHLDRFFELFFNLGYKYTERKNILSRFIYSFESSKDEEQKECGTFRLWDSITPIKDNSYPSNITFINAENVDNCIPTTYYSISVLSDIPPCDNWELKKGANGGYGIPISIPITSKSYDNCDDTDVLFQEDLATMLACSEIYKIAKSWDGTEKITSNDILSILKTRKLPEEYIFNSFVGDSTEKIKSFTNRTNVDISNITSIELDYNKIGYVGVTNNKPKVCLGREVTTYDSLIKIYNIDTKQYEIAHVWQLPMVTFFIDIVSSTNNYDNILEQYFYSFYQYNFQVPKLLSDDGSPTLIGSGAFIETDENRCKLRKTESWTSNFTLEDIPHRHCVFETFVSNLKMNKNKKFKKVDYHNKTCLDEYQLANAWTGNGKFTSTISVSTKEKHPLSTPQIVNFDEAKFSYLNFSDANIKIYSKYINKIKIGNISKLQGSKLQGNSYLMNYDERFSFPKINANSTVSAIAYDGGGRHYDDSKVAPSLYKSPYPFTSLSNHGFGASTNCTNTNYIINPLKKFFAEEVYGHGYATPRILSLERFSDNEVKYFQDDANAKNKIYIDDVCKNFTTLVAGKYVNRLWKRNIWYNLPDTWKKQQFKYKKSETSTTESIQKTSALSENNTTSQDDLNIYTFNMNEDPRFQHGEPNRGLTSPPITTEMNTIVRYYKSQDAKNNFYLAESSNWFAPENIQMLPLIKI